MCISFVTSLGRASIEYVILFIYLFILRVNLNSSKGTGRSFSPKVNRGRGEKINTKYCENVKWHNSLEWELRQPPCAHKKATLIKQHSKRALLLVRKIDLNVID